MFDVGEAVLDSSPGESWDRCSGGLPADLDGWVPGPFLADVVACVDPEALDDEQLVVYMRAEARLAAWLEARRVRTMVRVREAIVEAYGDEEEALVWESAAAEIGCALTLTHRAAERRLGFASTLYEDHPRVWAALHAGLVDVAKAHVMVDCLSGVAPGIAEMVTSRILGEVHKWTTGQIRARLNKLVAEADPAAVREAYEEGVETRCLVADQNWDGTANVCGWNLPADRVAEARAHINQIARSLKTAGEARSMDQLRADVFLDLLCGISSTGHTGGGVVDIRVDLTTLAGLSEAPGEIPGFGPVIADIARRIAVEHGNSWQITLTHQDQPVWVGTTRRRPTAELTRRVRARYPHCVFPGCRMPARNCDIDHNQAVSEGGPTTEPNLSPLCRRHHILKHHGWTPKRLPDGRYQWTSPLGHTYITDHPP